MLIFGIAIGCFIIEKNNSERESSFLGFGLFKSPKRKLLVRF